MDIKEIALMLNSFSSGKIASDNKVFYEIVEKVIDLTKINIEYEINNDLDYKRDLIKNIIKDVSTNLNSVDKQNFYDLIDTKILRFCGDEKLKLEQIKNRNIRNKLDRLADWVHSDEIKEEILNGGEFTGEQLDTSDICKLVKSLESIEKRVEYFNKYKDQFFSEDPQYVINIIDTIDEKKNKIELFMNLSESQLDILVNQRSDFDEIKLVSILKSNMDVNDKLKRIGALKSDENKIFAIDIIHPANDYLKVVYLLNAIDNKTTLINAFIKKDILEDFLLYSDERGDFEDSIKDNIDNILKYYGYEEKKNLLLTMEKSNSKIYSTIQFELLDDRFVHAFSENQLNIIASIKKEQIKLFNFDENQLKLFSKLIQNRKEDDFREFYSNIVQHMQCFKKLTSNIDFRQLTEENLVLLSKIMQFNNDFDIESLDDVNNFEQIKNDKINDIIKNSNSSYNEMIESIIWKQFGIDFKTAERLAIEFSDEASNNEKLNRIRILVNLAKEYNSTDINGLRQLLEKVYNTTDTNDTSIEDIIDSRNIYKNLFEREISNSLVNIKDLNKKKLEDGTIVYEAGTDFNLIITAISPFIKNKSINNSKENWNRADLGSEHFCASYIRYDMIGLCKTELGIYYGFNEIIDGSIIYMNHKDSASSQDPEMHSSINEVSKFEHSDKLINNTNNYNEVDIKRRMNGKRIQPDYLVVFKNRGEYFNLKETIKASKEWSILPIVEIDIDKCIEKQIEQLNEMSVAYSKDLESMTLEEIWNKYNNMFKTLKNWKKYDEIKQIDEQIKLPKELLDIIKPKRYGVGYNLKEKDIFHEKDDEGLDELVDDLKKAYSIDDKEIDIQEGAEKKDEGIEEKTAVQIEDKDEISNEEIESEAEIINEVDETGLVDEAKYAENYYKTRNKTNLISRVIEAIKTCINKMLGKDEQNTH